MGNFVYPYLICPTPFESCVGSDDPDRSVQIMELSDVACSSKATRTLNDELVPLWLLPVVLQPLQQQPNVFMTKKMDTSFNLRI